MRLLHTGKQGGMHSRLLMHCQLGPAHKRANMTGNSGNEEAFAPFLPGEATTTGVDGAGEDPVIALVASVASVR